MIDKVCGFEWVFWCIGGFGVGGCGSCWVCVNICCCWRDVEVVFVLGVVVWC